MLCHQSHPICLAFIALGSNLEQPASQVQRGFDELARLPSSRLLMRSSLYCSAPVGRLDQPDFVNAVAQIETGLAPHDLLQALLEIEHRHGRVRTQVNAPRILDLDVLMYADLQCHESGLTLPHPRMHERAFVLQPLLEIAPACHIPGRGAVSGLLAACAGQRLERMRE